MSAIEAAIDSSIPSYLDPVETLSRTDDVFWELIKSQIPKNKDEMVTFETDTSLKNEEYINYAESSESSGSTFSIQAQEKQLRNNIEILFSIYVHEEFEDGMDNEFIEELRLYILKYGTKAIDAIANIIANGSVKPLVIFEALRWLGSITPTCAYRSRLLLLERSLRSPSRWIRDGAALGLASMEDVSSIPDLRNAIDKEKIQDLRKDMETVLHHLEHIAQCQNTF